MKAKHDYFCRYDDFVGKLGSHIGQTDKRLITKDYKEDIKEFCISGDMKKLHRVFASIRNEIFPYIIGIGCQAIPGINITLNSAIDVNQKNGTGWIADNIICIIEEIFYARKNCIEKSKNMDFLEQRFVYKMYLYSCISLVELYLNILLKKSITDKDRQIPEKIIRIDDKILILSMKKIAKGDDNKWGNKEWVRQQISNIKQEDANFKAGYDAFDYLRTQRNKITHSQDNEYSVIERECVEALNKVNNLGILLEFLENCFVSIGGTAMQKSWLSQFQNIITHKPPMGIKTMYPIILQCFPKISL